MTLKAKLFFIGVAAILFVVNVVVTHNVLTEPYPGHNDFLSRWEPARGFWQEGLNPYSDKASLNIQMIIYGRPALPTDDLGLFVYPFYVVFVLLPLSFMDYAWASAIWMVFLEACLIGALMLILDLFKWRPKPLLLVTLIFWSLLAYFPARGLLLGQVGHLVYLLEILAIWALARRSDTLAGLALALSTIKPQMGYLLVPFLLLWALRVRRWHFIQSFTVLFSVLMGLSFLLQPAWMSEWLHQVSAYPNYTELGGPVWIIANAPWLHVDPVINKWVVTEGFGHIIDPILSLLTYGFMLWAWFEVLWRGKQERFLWTVVLTLLMTHLAAPRTATPHYVVFMIPLIFYLRELVERVRFGTLYAYGLLLLLLVVPWLHFLATIKGDFENPTVFLPVPLVLLVALWFTRQQWWHDETPGLSWRSAKLSVTDNSLTGTA